MVSFQSEDKGLKSPGGKRKYVLMWSDSDTAPILHVGCLQCLLMIPSLIMFPTEFFIDYQNSIKHCARNYRYNNE